MEHSKTIQTVSVNANNSCEYSFFFCCEWYESCAHALPLPTTIFFLCISFSYIQLNSRIENFKKRFLHTLFLCCCSIKMWVHGHTSEWKYESAVWTKNFASWINLNTFWRRAHRGVRERAMNVCMVYHYW